MLKNMKKVFRSGVAIVCTLCVTFGAVVLLRSNRVITAAEEITAGYTVYTFSDAGITDRSLTVPGDVSGRLPATSFDKIMFRGTVTFPKNPSYQTYLRVLGDTPSAGWESLSFFAAPDGKLYLQDTHAGGFGMITSFDNATAGCTVAGAPVDFAVSADITGSDVNLGVYFNGKLYNNDYITLKNYAAKLGPCVLVYTDNASYPITVASYVVPEPAAELPEELKAMKELTLTDFGVDAAALSANGYVNGVGYTCNTVSSFDNTYLNLDVDFGTQSNDGTQYIRWAGIEDGWVGLAVESALNNELTLRDWKTSKILMHLTEQKAGTKFYNGAFNLKISTQFVDSDSDGNKDDVKIGLYFNNKLYDNAFVYETDRVADMTDRLLMYTKDGFSQKLKVGLPGTLTGKPGEEPGEEDPQMPTDLKKITFSDFGIQDGSYANTTATGKLQGLSSLNGTLFSGKVNIANNANTYIRYGGNASEWLGLSFQPWMNSDHDLKVAFYKNDETVAQTVTFTAKKAGVSVVDQTYDLKISTQFVDSDSDGNKDDVQFGFFFNDKLYDGKYVTVPDYVPHLGTNLLLYSDNPGKPVAVESVQTEEQAEVLPTDLNSISFADFGVADGTYGYNNNALSVEKRYTKTLDGTLFSADVKFEGQAALHYGGSANNTDVNPTGAAPWTGVKFTANADGTITVSDAYGRFSALTMNAETAGTALVGTSFNLKLTTQYVDSDKDGNKDDVKFGIWVNDKLYGNSYCEWKDYAQYMDNYLGIYCPTPASKLTVGSGETPPEPPAETVPFPTKGYKVYKFSDFGLTAQTVHGTATGKKEITAFNKVAFRDKLILPENTVSHQTYVRFFGDEDGGWQGLNFYVEDGKLRLTDSHIGGLGALMSFDPVVAGVGTFDGKQLDLGLTLDIVGNDVKLGVYFNNALYDGKTITLSNYKNRLGGWLLAYTDNNEVPITVGTPGEEPEIGTDTDTDPATLKLISFSNFGIPNGTLKTTNPKNGEGALFGALKGLDGLNGTRFSADVRFTPNSGNEYIRFGGQDGGWTGLSYQTNITGGTCFMNPVNDEKIVDFKDEIAGVKLCGEAYNLKISFEFVDADKDGRCDDVKLAFYFNNKRYADKYYYALDRVPVMTSALLVYTENATEFPVWIRSVKGVYEPPRSVVDFTVFGFDKNWAKTLGDTSYIASVNPEKTETDTPTPAPQTSDVADVNWYILIAALSLGVLIPAGKELIIGFYTQND